MRLPKLNTTTALIGLAVLALSKRKTPAPAPAAPSTPQGPAPGTLQVPKAGSPTLSFAQLRELARAVGIPDEQLDTAAAIALAESNGGHPDALGDQGHSFGLWQINIPAHPEYAPGPQLFDPTLNAVAMAAISNHGKNWHPWSTYNNGLHLPYMPRPPIASGEPARLPAEPPASADPVEGEIVAEVLDDALPEEGAAEPRTGRGRRARGG